MGEGKDTFINLHKLVTFLDSAIGIREPTLCYTFNENTKTSVCVCLNKKVKNNE